MSEKIGFREGKENWDGHSFKDSCEWERIKTIPHLTPGALWRANIEHIKVDMRNKLDMPYFNKIRAARLNSSEHPIRTLTDGQVFNVADFTVGTILKVNGNTQGKFKSFPWDHWGIIEQERDVVDDVMRDVVITFPEAALDKGVIPRYGGMRGLHTIFPVGEVLHDRSKDAIFRNQHLTRYDSVEIWKYGRGLRSRVKSPVGVGALAPQIRTM